MKLKIHLFAHSNILLVYSYFYYCRKHKIKVDVEIDKSVHFNGGLIQYQDKTLFFDYTDDADLIEDPSKYDFYFKRSLLKQDYKGNVHPLNFNLPMSYNSLGLLSKMNYEFFKDKQSRIEVIRALDMFDWFTNNSHKSMDVRRYPTKIQDNDGAIIYYTRLWNPDRTPDADEKERRIIQNEFRINACRIIKDNFKNSSVGLFPDDFSRSLAPDILLDLRQTDKKNYFKKLNNCNIGIADDGLKNTPGWKIGEYLLSGKAVISTPLNICVDNFNDGEHYLELQSRSSYQELPDKIEMLLKEKKYLEMAENNLKWSREYIHPFNYLERIFAFVDMKAKL